MNEPRPSGRRRRHLRKLLRVALWGTAALALLVLVLWWISGAAWTQARVLRLAEARLEETLGREVLIGDLDYGFRPFLVVAEDVVIPGPDRGDESEPPFARIPRVELELSFSGWFKPVLSIERVELERPEVWMIFYPDGTNNLPELKTGEGGGRLEIVMGRLSVQQGVFHLDELEIPLDLDAAPVRAVLEGPAVSERVAEDHLVGTVVVGDLDLGLPDARPWGGSASARVVIGPGRVEVEGGRLRGPDLAARFEAVYRFGDAAGDAGEGGEVTVTADGTASLVNRLGYLEDTLSGPFHLVAEVDLEPEGASYHGTVTSPRLGFAGRRFADLEATFSGGAGGLVVEVVEAEHAGGVVQATVSLPDVEEDADLQGMTDAGRPVLVEARGRDLRIATLVDDLDLEDSPLAGVRGRASAELVYRFSTEAPLAGDGDGVVRLAGVERPGEERLPVSGRVPLEIRNGVLTIRDAALTAPGQRLALSGSYDLEAGSGRFDYQLDSERLGRLVQALPLPPEVVAEGVPPWLPTGGTGTIRGEIELRPGGGYSVEAATELAAVETTLGRIDRLSAPITLEDGLLRTDDLVLEGLGQRLLLSGTYDLETRQVEGDFRLTSEDLGRLAAVLPLEGEERPPWLPRGGDGRVEGNLHLSTGGVLTGRVQLDLEEVALAGITLDRLDGSFRLEPGAVRDLRLEATTDGGALIASGSAPLPAFGEDAATDWRREPFDLSLDAVDWPLESLAAAMPDLPALSGDLDLEGEITGTFENPRGRVQATADPLAVADLEVDRLAVDLRLDGPRLSVDSLRLEAPAGEVVAEGSWNRDTGALDLRLESVDALALSEPPLAGLVPGELSGRIVLAATVGGTLEQPRVTLESSARNLAVAGRDLGEDGRAAFQATWIDERLEAEGSLLGVVDFVGGGLLTTERADVEVRLEVEDVDGLLHLAAGAPLEGLSGALAGTLQVAGRFDTPAGPDAVLRLDPVRLAYQGREIYNLEPVVVRYEPGRLVVDSLFLGEPQEQGAGELFVTGTVGLEGEQALDLRVQADLSASWAELVLEDYEMGGRIQALASVGGTLGNPAVNGQGEVRGGTLILPDFPHALENVDAIALFYPNRIVLDSAEARLGGGRLRAEGSVDLAGLPQGDLDYRFQVRLRDATLRYPEGFLLRGGGNVTVTTTPDGRLISGVIELERAFYLEDVPVGVTQLLANVFEPTRLEAGTADPEAAATQLNLSIQGPGALRVRNNVADLSGDIDLVLRGTAADPALFGRVEVAEGGEIVYAENEYRVDRGLLTFANPYRIDPVIDLVATTEVRNYDITLSLTGTLDDLEASFNSDPPLADLEVVSLLTVGRPIQPGALLSGSPAAEGGAGGASRAAEQLLYGQAASLLSERVNTLFGFDRFRVSPGTTASGSSSLAVTVGQQISRDLFVTYSRDPATPEQDIIQIEWQAYENVLLVLTTRGDETYALDIQVERRF